jgi:hypothetical protein
VRVAPFPALELADGVGGQTSSFGELLLREARRLAIATQLLPERGVVIGTAVGQRPHLGSPPIVLASGS